MLIDELKKAKIEAMKAKDNDKRAILDIVINKYLLLSVENRTKGIENSDADLLSIIQKVIKELADEKNGYMEVNNQEKVQSIENQSNVLKEYLPKQLSEEDILNEINKLEDKSMPNIMKHFKMNFQGQVDMGLVSRLAKNIK